MTKPNFFFIGAPKCGTTSIAYHLSQHPNIFITNPKEPHFFEKEIPRGIQSKKAYESLFLKVKQHHTIVGEASTGYLYSQAAIPEIRSCYPESKFLVSVRNPYEMAISLHGQALRGKYENQLDFNVAWKLQRARRRGANLPEACISPVLLLYGDRCALGDQIERLYSMVSPENVCLVFFDDLVNNPAGLYNKIYEFLGVPDFDARDFPVLNQKKHIRWPFVASVVRSLGKAKSAIGINKSLGIADRLMKIASVNPVEKQVIRDDVWLEMDDAFMTQIKKIESFSGRDLRHWYYFRSND